MENRIEKKTVSTVDMTTEVFKAMSQGSASSIRCLYQIAFSGRLLPKQKPEQQELQLKLLVDYKAVITLRE